MTSTYYINRIAILVILLVVYSCGFEPNITVSLPKKNLIVTDTTQNYFSLDSIADQTTNEGVAITTIDAGMNALDVDHAGRSISYTCFYDTVIDGAVSSITSCSALSGLNFSGATGVMNWLSDMTQAGSYEFMISGTNGQSVSDVIFSINISNVNQAPVLDFISNQTINENTSMTTIDASDSGSDYDADGDLITYACYYDTTVDGVVASVNSCSSLGASFSVGTGVLDWIPTYSQSGVYEFVIEGSDGALVGNRIFTVTVNNVNRAPVLDSISNQTVTELSSIAAINAGVSGADTDIDGQTLTYTCYYDSAVDGSVGTTNACSSLSGVSFTASTGVMNWTPSHAQIGNYEFKIVGSDGSLSDEVIFTITVNAIPPQPFVSKWQTTTPNESISLPLSPWGTYNFQVDWGDGSTVDTVTSFGDINATHLYTSAGTYTVTISGLMDSIYFNNTGSRSNIIEVVNLGNIGLTSLSHAFHGCDNLVSFAGGNTSEVVDMDFMFADTASLTTIDLSSFNTSKVTRMNAMFQNATAVTNLNLSSFDTSSVTTMSYMFWRIDSIISLNLSSFDTSNVTDMAFMFYYSTALASINLTNFDTTNVTDMSYMFFGLSSIASIDVSSFDTTNVTNMSYMFAYNYVLANLNLSNFNTANVTNMNSMFSGMTALSSLNISNFDTSHVTNMNSMFYGVGAMNTIDLSSFDTSQVTNMYGMFANSSFTSLDLSQFDTGNVTNMASMFSVMRNLSSINLKGAFDTTKVTDMSRMFYICDSLTDLDLTNFNTSNVIDMMSMFSSTFNLVNLNTSTFDTSKVTTMSAMFADSRSIPTLDLSHFNTIAVTSMEAMFAGTISLTSLNISSFNTSNVTEMRSMFYSTGLGSLSLANFNTGNVTDMSYMFKFATGLTTLNLSNFNTSKVTDVTEMFTSTISMTSLNLNNWDIAMMTNTNNVFSSTNSGLQVQCDQPSGTIFSVTCL